MMQTDVVRQAVEVLEATEKASGDLARPTVAYLGPPYSHSHIAAEQAFPEGQLLACPSFKSIFQRLYEEDADYGLVPIQNSLNGPIGEPLGQVFEWTDKDGPGTVTGFGDFSMRIRNYLVAKGDMPLTSIRRIYTKEEAHRQCSDFLMMHGLDDRVEHVGSTSQAAEIVGSRKGQRIAAICTVAAAEHHGLVLLVPDSITDDPTNRTRFLKVKLAETPLPASDANGPSIVLVFFVLQDEPGTLHRVLAAFAKVGHNLRDVFTGPLRPSMRVSSEFKDWFFLDYAESDRDTAFATTINGLGRRRELYHAMKVVGQFRTEWS